MSLTDITFLSGISPNPYSFVLQLVATGVGVARDITFGKPFRPTAMVLQTRLISETITITMT